MLGLTLFTFVTIWLFNSGNPKVAKDHAPLNLMKRPLPPLYHYTIGGHSTQHFRNSRKPCPEAYVGEKKRVVGSLLLTCIFERVFNLGRGLESGEGCPTISFNGCHWWIGVPSKFDALFIRKPPRTGS